MMRRAVVGVGRALRETGQAVERMGCRAQDNWIFQEKFSRHRAVMNLFDQRPDLGPQVFVAPSATIVGNVEVKPHTSVWCAERPLPPPASTFPHPSCGRRGNRTTGGRLLQVWCGRAW